MLGANSTSERIQHHAILLYEHSPGWLSSKVLLHSSPFGLDVEILSIPASRYVGDGCCIFRASLATWFEMIQIMLSALTGISIINVKKSNMIWIVSNHVGRNFHKRTDSTSCDSPVWALPRVTFQPGILLLLLLLLFLLLLLLLLLPARAFSFFFFFRRGIDVT